MTEATITVQNISTDTAIVSIAGQLDESNVDEKIKALYAVVENNPKGLKLILDLENLDYMNSKSIGYLTDIYGKVTEGAGKMAIAKAKSNIVDILQVVGLTQLIESFDTIEDARTAIGSTTEISAATPAVVAPPTVPAEQIEVATPEIIPATQVEQTPLAPPADSTAPQSTETSYKLDQ